MKSEPSKNTNNDNDSNNSSLKTSPTRFEPQRLLNRALLKELSKSGIVTLVMISVTAGYFIGHSFEKKVSILHFLFSFFGILFLASGSSALNQIQEIHIDEKMPRTANRPLPSGKLSLYEALFFSVTAILSGLTILFQIDISLFFLGLFAVLSYNVLYTLWWKKTMAFGAIPGAIPGALPILMGFVASGADWKNPGGWFLFFILFFWQMPHFWSLAIRYSDDYEKGGIPTLPVTKGVPVTMQQITLWCLGYVALSLAAPLFLRVGSVYLGISLLTGIILLIQLFKFIKSEAKKEYWLKFFLWINFSILFYLGGLVIDQWSIYLIPFFKV